MGVATHTAFANKEFKRQGNTPAIKERTISKKVESIAISANNVVEQTCKTEAAVNVIKQQVREEIFRDNVSFENIMISYRPFDATQSNQYNTEYVVDIITNASGDKTVTRWQYKNTYLVNADKTGTCNALLLRSEKVNLITPDDILPITLPMTSARKSK